jgi:CRISPR-associated protein Csx3
MIRLLPAVLIGGPAHPQKTMLFSGLTRALRERHILHHAVRVCSASEELWFPTDTLASVRRLAICDTHENELIEAFSQELSRRLLPVLIDVTIDHQHLQACILRHCTHLTFLPHEHDQVSQDFWSQLGERYGLLPLLDTYPSFESALSASKTYKTQSTFLNPEQSSAEHHPLFDCLAERVIDLFSAYSEKELMEIYVRQSPTSLVLHIPSLLQTLTPTAESWEPEMLPAVLAYIPAQTPLSVYGQGPQWLYAALAAYADRADFYQFDTCLLPGDVSSGWVASPPLLLSTTTRLEVHVVYTDEGIYGQLAINIQEMSLDHLQVSSLPFPPVPPYSGLILVGSTPTWMLTALVRLYARAGVPWIACRQAQHCRDVVVFSRTTRHFVGENISIL